MKLIIWFWLIISRTIVRICRTGWSLWWKCWTLISILSCCHLFLIKKRLWRDVRIFILRIRRWWARYWLGFYRNMLILSLMISLDSLWSLSSSILLNFWRLSCSNSLGLTKEYLSVLRLFIMLSSICIMDWDESLLSSILFLSWRNSWLELF